jgi:mRNA interferase RelE/StbE
VIWEIRVAARAQRDIRKLDPQSARRVRTFLEERLATAQDPRQVGTSLRSQDRLWRYRVGDLRIIAELQDTRLVVLVVQVGHRREIYRR